MANISERKRIANRENAKKSTGPKSIQGKELAKFNALKHGLTAALAVPEELREEADARAGSWLREMKPRDGAEAWLVVRAATDAVRVDAATRCERARLALRIQREHLYSNADGIPEVHSEGLGKQLLAGVDDNGATLVKLLSRRAGCDWLIARWEDLKRRHEAQGMWELREFTEAQRLMGANYLADLMTSEMAFLCLDFLLAQEEGLQKFPKVMYALHQARWEIKDLLDAQDVPKAPNSRVRANARLRYFVDGKIADLVERRDTLAEAEACENALAAECLLMDTSAEGKLLHRYETELLRRVHQSVDQLANLQKGRAEIENSLRNEATEAVLVPISRIVTPMRPAIAAGEDGNSLRNEATEVPSVPVETIATTDEVEESPRNEATEAPSVPVGTVDAVCVDDPTRRVRHCGPPRFPGAAGAGMVGNGGPYGRKSPETVEAQKTSRNEATDSEMVSWTPVEATDWEARVDTPQMKLREVLRKEMEAFQAAPKPTYTPRRRARQ